MTCFIRWCSILSLILPGCMDPSGVDGDGDGVFSDVDCDDSDPAVWPGRVESCDGIDNNCDGQVDEGVVATWYADRDGDNFGDDEDWIEACRPPDSFVVVGGDCDDMRADVNPMATEWCDEQDNDCDGEVDEEVQSRWFYDGDTDGFGNTTVWVESCAAPSGYVELDGDCDDGDAGTYPGAAEVCDHRDQDCDGVVDNGVLTTWYVDSDFDGYGDSDRGVQACEAPEGTVALGEDCDDADAATYPGAKDFCDGQDNDCDETIDEDHKKDWILIAVKRGTVYEIDPTTAIYSVVNFLSESTGATTTEVREDGVGYLMHSAVLHEMDVCSGAVTEIGETSAESIGGMAFGPGGTLYALDSEQDTLIAINSVTAESSEIGSVGTDLGNSGMTYDCANGVVYGVDGNTSSLLALDLVSGSYTSKTALTTSTGASIAFRGVGLEYDAASGMLWMSSGSALYSVDPATATATLVDTFWDGGSASMRFNNLAFHPSCP